MTLLKATIIFLKTLLCCVITAKTYIITVEEIRNCDNVSNRNIINTNYNYTAATTSGHGYVDMLTTIEWEKNFQVSIEVYQKSKGAWSRAPSFCIQKTSLCIVMATDLVFHPMFRAVLNADFKCPKKKERHTVQISRLSFKHNLFFSFGCLSLNVTLENPNAKHSESVCIVLHVAESFKPNHPTCNNIN